MKRKLALLLTLLLTLSLVNLIPAAASAEDTRTLELGDFVLIYGDPDFTATLDERNKLLILSCSRETYSPCKVSMATSVKQTDYSIKLIGEVHMQLESIKSTGDMILAGACRASILFNGKNMFNTITTLDDTVLSDLLLSGNGSLEVYDEIAVKNCALEILDGTLLAPYITCRSFNMEGGKVTANYAAMKQTHAAYVIKSTSIKLSGGDFTAQHMGNRSAEVDSVFSSAPVLDYQNGYYWYASADDKDFDKLTKSADLAYTYSKEHKYIRLMATEALIDVDTTGLCEPGEHTFWFGDGSSAVMRMNPKIDIMYPFAISVVSDANVSMEMNDMNLCNVSQAIGYDDMPIVEIYSGATVDLNINGNNRFYARYAYYPAFSLREQSHFIVKIGLVYKFSSAAPANTALYSGALTINAAGAGFDGTGRLTLNNVPLTITSGTGKAFGSLTDIELNYPNGYIWRASKTGGTGTYHNSSSKPFVLDDYTYVEIMPIMPEVFEGADGYIFRTYEDWLRDQAEKDLMAPPSGLQPDPKTEPEDLFAD